MSRNLVVTLFVVAALVMFIAGCAPARAPSICELAAKYPEARDPVVASMFGLPTAGCAR